MRNFGNGSASRAPRPAFNRPNLTKAAGAVVTRVVSDCPDWCIAAKAAPISDYAWLAGIERRLKKRVEVAIVPTSSSFGAPLAPERGLIGTVSPNRATLRCCWPTLTAVAGGTQKPLRLRDMPPKV
jgi:hypothetical protein